MRRLSVLIGTVALVMAVTLVRLPFDGRGLAPVAPVPEEAPAGQIEGQLEGWVWKVDPQGRRVLVGRRLLGFGATPLVVTDETRVIVGRKEGAFGDLREGLRVRVAWERGRDARVARSVEVLERRESPAERGGRPGATAPDGATPASPDRARASDAEARPAEPQSPPRPGREEVADSTAARSEQTVPAPLAPPARMPPRSPGPTPGPPAKGTPAPPGAWRAVPPRETAAPAGEADATDPAAVIDWLLNAAPIRRP